MNPKTSVWLQRFPAWRTSEAGRDDGGQQAPCVDAQVEHGEEGAALSLLGRGGGIGGPA